MEACLTVSDSFLQKQWQEKLELCSRWSSELNVGNFLLQIQYKNRGWNVDCEVPTSHWVQLVTQANILSSSIVTASIQHLPPNKQHQKPQSSPGPKPMKYKEQSMALDNVLRSCICRFFQWCTVTHRFWTNMLLLLQGPIFFPYKPTVFLQVRSEYSITSLEHALLASHKVLPPYSPRQHWHSSLSLCFHDKGQVGSAPQSYARLLTLSQISKYSNG